MRKVLSTIITIVLTVALLGGLTNLFERKTSKVKNNQFINEEHQFDVLYFGTSHVKDGIIPMTIWDEYGITGYNMGFDGHALPTSYWVMKNAFRINKPKVVVIDCYYLSKETKSDDTYQLHQSMDIFPISITKIRGIVDILDDPLWEEERAANPKEMDDPRDALNFLWNYSMYHTRWDNDLTFNDFYIEENLEKGAEAMIGVESGESITYISDDEKSNPDALGEKYLRRMIEECQKENVQVLLTYLPGETVDYRQKEANRVEDIASEYGVSYINFVKLDLVDFDTDMYNHGGGDNAHLNLSGARKVSKVIGEELAQNYGLSDKRENPEYDDWRQDSLITNQYEDFLIGSQEDIRNYLLTLAGTKNQVYVECDGEVLQCQMLSSLFENLIRTTPVIYDLKESENGLDSYHISFVITNETEEIDRVGFEVVLDSNSKELVSCIAVR